MFELQDDVVTVANARALTTGMGQNLIERFPDKVRARGPGARSPD